MKLVRYPRDILHASYIYLKILFIPEKKKLGNLKPIFISVDPSRDTIGQMRHYSQDFHPAIDYLTGTTEQVATVARAYRVYFRWFTKSIKIYSISLDI